MRTKRVLRRNRLFALVVAFALVVVIVGPVAVSGGDGDAVVYVSLAPAATDAGVDEQVAFDVVVERADNGISAYSVQVSVANESAATITDYSYNLEPDFDNSELRSEARLQFEAAQGANVYDPADELILGTVHVTAAAEGETALAIDEVVISDNDDQRYEIGDSSGATLTVVGEESGERGVEGGTVEPTVEQSDDSEPSGIGIAPLAVVAGGVLLGAMVGVVGIGYLVLRRRS